MGFAIGGALIGLGAKAGSAYLEGQAKKSAANAQIGALNNLEEINVEDLKKLASSTDIERFKQQLQTQAENDPRYAALRNQGAAGILRALQEDRTGTGYSDTALKTIGEETSKTGADTQAVVAQLLDRAKKDLQAGATLPPEFQAELVRSGLEKSGGTGSSIEGRGAAGTSIRQLLGSAGIELQAKRVTEAQGAAGAAGNIQSQRAAILSDLATLDNNLRGAKVQRAAGAAAMGSASVPAIGLTGADAANASVANTNQRNQATLAIGALNAQKKLASGEMWSNILGATGSAVSSFMGGVGAGAGAGAGGFMSQSGQSGFSGIGSWIGGLLGTKSATLTQSDLTPVYR